MAEVDKFKRRVIRAVARLLRRDQTPGEEMWKALQNEAGCDCKLLWKRMRALTLKKMRRLILAEDRLDNIAAVAKMTMTDWLLFDLVLVHEDIDVIGQDLKIEPSMLTDLFNVVKRFNIEGKQGDALATAWTAATFYYNSFGRQCSPMLLQRRWYQLKKLTRSNFYKFWFNYRGAARYISAAKEFQPTKLQSDIAQRFPHIVTMNFMEWDKMIKEKWVILPEEFEAKIRKKRTKLKSAENEPDIVLLEPQIETIDLGVDSDHESEPADDNSKDSNTAQSTPLNPVSLAAAIKSEPQDEFEMDFEDGLEKRALEIGELPDENAVDNDDTVPADEPIDNDVDMQDEVHEINAEINAMPKISSIAGNFNEDSVSNDSVDDVVKQSNTVMEEINDILKTAVDGQTVKEATDSGDGMASPGTAIQEEPAIIDLDESDDATTGITHRSDVMSEIDNILVSAIKEKMQTKHLDLKESVANIIEDINEVSEKKIDLDYDNESKEKDSGEFIKDKESEVTDVKVEETPFEDTIGDITNVEQAGACKIETIADPILDLPPDVTFEDDGIEMVDDGIAFEEDDHKEETITVKCESEDSASGDEKSGEEPSIDPKLLMYPCVYTIKLEDMIVFQNKNIQEVKDTLIIEGALFESKMHIKKEEIKKEEHESSKSEDSDSDDGIPDSRRVKITSYMLQKPKSRSYNPIQLCKNPDFNTRLKRLTVGFLSSNRNRHLLKCLKPMTVDLSKAFESKLIDGTVYLKSDDGVNIKREEPEEVIDERSVSAVMPCAMPVQSLIDNSRICLRDLLPPPPPPERQRTITLPDIDNIRRINQNLLTAEVTPMRIHPIDPPVPPVQLVNARPASPPAPADIQPSEPIPVPETPRVVDPVSKDPVSMDAISKDPVSKVSISKGPIFKDPVPKDSVSKGPRSKELVSKDSVSKNPVSKDAVTKDVVTKDVVTKDVVTKDVVTKDVVTKDVVTKDVVTKDVVTKDVVTKDLVSKDPVTKDPISKDPANEANPAEKRRKQMAPRPRYNLNWNSIKRIPAKPAGEDDFLLTLDALNKMLHIFSDGEKPDSDRVTKKKLMKRKMELQKRMDLYELGRDDESSETKEVADDVSKPEPVKEKKKKPEPKPDAVTPKIKVVQDKTFSPYCCWARYKIETEGQAKKVARAHRCPRICHCCCRDELAKKFCTRPKPRLVRVVRPSTIVISDDEDGEKLKNVCESIENVVQQSVNVTRPSPTIVLSAAQPESSSENVQTDLATSLKVWSQPATSEILKAQPAASIRVWSEPATSGIGRTQPAPMPKIRIEPATSGQVRAEASVQSDMASGRTFFDPRVVHVKAAKSTARSQAASRPDVVTITDELPDTRRRRSIRIRRDLLQYKLQRPPAGPGHITIDARKSNDVRISSEPLNITAGNLDTIVYMNSKQKITSPVFLGENKILLTDIKFPAAIASDGATVPAVVPIAPAVPEPLLATTPVILPLTPPPVPAGVQVILLPDGQLTYTVDPGVTLTDEALTSMPIILDAIRQQLEAASAADTRTPVAPNDVVNLTDDGMEVLPSADALTAANNAVVTNIDVTAKDVTPIDAAVTNIDSTTNETTVENVGLRLSEENTDATGKVSSAAPSDSENDVTNQSRQLTTEVSTNQTSTVAEEHRSKTPIATEASENVEPATGDQTSQMAAENTPPLTDNESNVSHEPTSIANSNRKTLLSDLMEMSGILEDDIQTNEPVTSENTAPILDISATLDVSVAPHSNIHVPRVTAGPAMPNVPELTPVTSFSQLKYACERNGRFFKLDLQLGTLTKITVAIKKNKPKVSLMQKSVIDLTEDQDEQPKLAEETKAFTLDEAALPMSKIKTNQNHIVLNEEIIPGTKIKTNRSLLKKNQLNQATPLKLFRSIRILKNKNPVISLKSSDGSPVITYSKHRRKQQLQNQLRSEPSVELEEEENEGMAESQLGTGRTEEEWLDESLDSSELDEYIWKDNEDASESDSSDDEPLANKAKRMRLKKDENPADVVEEKVAQHEVVSVEGNPGAAVNVVTTPWAEMLAEKKSDNERVIKKIDQEDIGMVDDVNVAEGVKMATRSDVVEKSGAVVAGIEVPIEGDVDLLPALQEIERMDEDEDDEDCILGF